MLKGTREVILQKVRPLSVHGQISWDIYFADADDRDGPTERCARRSRYRCRIGSSPATACGSNTSLARSSA